MDQLKQSILLVEDSEDDVFLMKQSLKAAGITIPLRVVDDGEQAIDYLAGRGKYSDRAAHPFPNLIFLDLKLPYKSGLDVLRFLHAEPNLPQTLVIVLTSSNEPSDLNAAYKLGAKSYLVKPPTRDELNKMVEAFKLYWLTYNRFPNSLPAAA